MPSKVAELRGLSLQDLQVELSNTEKELFNLQVRWSTRQLPSRGEITKAQKKIARLKTVAREAQIARVR